MLTRHCNLAKPNPAGSNLTKAQKGKAKFNAADNDIRVVREPIPPPPPPPSRAEHLRPPSPSLVRSNAPHTIAGRPSTSSLIHGFPINRHPTTFVVGAPWATPPVDRLMCALDARDLGTPEIIRRLKTQFPSLARLVITDKMVSTRTQLLDQRVDIDYFKYGIGLGSRSIEDGIGFTRGARHGAAIHAPQKTIRSDSPQILRKGVANILRPKTSSASLSAKRSQASLKTSCGALHGMAIHEEAPEDAAAASGQGRTGDTAGPLSSSAETSLSGGTKHGRLIHDEHKSSSTGGVSGPFSSTSGSSARKGATD